MYPEHFGLNEPPFKITPVTDFFFSGSSRGEILEALIYAITSSEGIIKITGEVGSGKTMLCRMLLKSLPSHVEPVYLANPSLSREEMLYAIADALGLDLEGKRVNVILQTLQTLLEQKVQQGKRVVILVDEAHAMPLDTLEELRLLYNMQVGDHKLLQIVLFGQPELNDKLDQPNMRQLKDRIVHHFIMLPLSKSTIESYLMFRMRAAGYRGPDIFSAAAVKLIGSASQGLMRRVNILADKALLAAFVANTHNIDTPHVQAAIRDSELSPARNNSRGLAALAGLLVATLALVGAGWPMIHKYLGLNAAPVDSPATSPSAVVATGALLTAPHPASAPVAAASAPNPAGTLAAAAQTATAASSPAAATAQASPSQHTGGAAVPTSSKPAPAAGPAEKPAKPRTRPKLDRILTHLPPMLTQRLDAGMNKLYGSDNSWVSLQLYYTESVRPARMERFLGRAKNLGVLDKIYILPIKIKGKDGFRVLYGDYPDSKSARAGIRQLPKRYQDAFATTLYFPDRTRTGP